MVLTADWSKNELLCPGHQGGVLAHPELLLLVAGGGQLAVIHTHQVLRGVLCKHTGLIRVKEERQMKFSKRWQSCFKGFVEGEAQGKS